MHSYHLDLDISSLQHTSTTRPKYGVDSVPKICWSISVQRVVVEMHPAPTEGAFGTEGDPLEGAFGTQRVPH